MVGGAVLLSTGLLNPLSSPARPPQSPSCPLEEAGALRVCLRPNLKLPTASALTTATTITPGAGLTLLVGLSWGCLPGPILPPINPRHLAGIGTLFLNRP